MNKKLFVLRVCLPVAAVLGIAIFLFQARHFHSITLRNLTQGETQTASISFLPHHLNWRVAGEVKGTGVVVVSYIYSNSVSGKFSANGRGDYYDTNVSVAFIPHGEAQGSIRASFWFNDWY